MTKDETLKLALAVLKSWRKGFPDDWTDFDSEAVKACEEALAQHDSVQAKPEPEQEPVACVGPWHDGKLTLIPRYSQQTFERDQPLYTTPPQRTWVGLTDNEIDQGLLRSDYAFKTAEAWRAGVVFAMTKLKQKNGYAEEKNK